MSQAVVHNGVAYLSGQIASDSSQDAVGQTRQVLATIDALLSQAGTDKGKVLRAQIFLKDMKDYASVNEVWDAWVVAGHTPVRAAVQAELVNPAWRVEIVVTAAV